MVMDGMVFCLVFQQGEVVGDVVVGELGDLVFWVVEQVYGDEMWVFVYVELVVGVGWY